MRRLLFTLFACLLPLVACAQESRHIMFEIAGTYAKPAGPQAFSDHWNDGFGVSGGVIYPLLGATRLSFLLDVSRFSLDDKSLLSEYELMSDYSLDGGAATLICGMANISVLFGNRRRRDVAPYIFGGCGVYHQSISDVTMAGHAWSEDVPLASETAVGFNIGLGLEIPAGRRANLFFDARYVVGLIEGTATQLAPVRFGIRTN